MNSSSQFPVYRKLSNEQRFYKIESSDCFTELQLVGKKVLKFSIRADQYPEKILIQDMVDLIHPFLESSSTEFYSVESRMTK